MDDSSSEFTSQQAPSCTAELTSPVSPVLPKGISVLINHAFLPDELPSTIKALNDGWLATYQISTVVVRALSRWYHLQLNERITHNSTTHLSTILTGSVVRRRRGPPSHSDQRRFELPQGRRQRRQARALNIHIHRTLLLHQRDDQRTHPDG